MAKKIGFLAGLGTIIAHGIFCFVLYPFCTRLAACGARSRMVFLRPTCLCSRNAPFNQLGEERANDSRPYGLRCLLGQLLMIKALESAFMGP